MGDLIGLEKEKDTPRFTLVVASGRGAIDTL